MNNVPLEVNSPRENESETEDSVLDKTVTEILGSASVEDVGSPTSTNNPQFDLDIANEITRAPDRDKTDHLSKKGNMDFTTWLSKHKLDSEIKSVLIDEGLDNMATLKKFPVNDINALDLSTDQKSLLKSAIQDLHVEDDTSELGKWAAENKINADTLLKLRGDGIDTLEKLKKITVDRMKELRIKAGQRVNLKESIDKLNDTEFVQFLRTKEVKEDTIKTLIQDDVDSRNSLTLMEKEDIQRLLVTEAQKRVLLSIRQELTKVESVTQSISYDEAYEKFLMNIGLEKTTIRKLLRFGMDSPEAMMILNADLGTLNMSDDQRVIVDDAIDKLKKFHGDPNMRTTIAKVLQSQKHTRNSVNLITQAYIELLAETEGVTQPATTNIANYMDSVGAKEEPEVKMLENGMRIVKLPVIQIYEDPIGKIRKCIIGNPDAKKQQKTIMIVGSSGAGKTTLVDGICNYVFDVKWNENNRFQLVNLHEDELKNEAKGDSVSQTEWITIYTINSGKCNKLPYTLNIIDSPGFGDTRGITRDQKLVGQIRHLFKKGGKHEIDEINAVCFVVKAPDARLTPTQSYIFNSILAVFGNDIKENILIMITFRDGARPRVLEAIRVAEVPYKKYFDFNNSALFENNGNTLEDDGNADATDFGKNFWKMGMHGYKTFFEFLGSLSPRSLTLSSKVLEQRQQLKDFLGSLEEKIGIGLLKMKALEEEENCLKANENRIKDNQDFSYKIMKYYTKKVQCVPGIYVTYCLNCKEVCHYDCIYKDDDDIGKCCLMDKEGKCRVCYKRCGWEDHTSTDYYLEHKEEEIEQTYNNKLREYKEATGIAAELEDIIQKTKEEYAAVEVEVKDYVGRCRDILQSLRKIALKRDPLTDVDYIDELINTEKDQPSANWRHRVKKLEKFKKDAENIQKLDTENDTDYRNLKF